MSITNAWKDTPMGRTCRIRTGKKDVNEGDPEGFYPFFTCSRIRTFSNSYSFDTDAILIAGNGEVGNLHRYIGKFEAYQRTYVLDTFSEDINYIYQYLNAFLKVNLARGHVGSTIPFIKLSDLTDFPIQLPTSKFEQTKIAEVLSTVDRAIDQTETLIAKQQRIKTGLMQDLLTRGIDEHGNIRSEQTQQFKDSPLGRIPVEWDVRYLRDIATYQNGKAFPSSDYSKSGVRLVRPGNLSSEGWVTWDEKHTTYLPVDYWIKSSSYQVKPGELLMNLTAQSLEDQFLGRVCMVPEQGDCLLNQRIARITPISCEKDFLFWVLKGPHFRMYVDSIPQGTKVQHLYNQNLDSARLLIPKSRSEQQIIAEMFWVCEKKIEITSKNLKKLRSLKRALLHDLLTGKKRVISLLDEEVING